MRTLGILTAAVLSSSTAWAADCATPYTIDALLEDLTVVEVALREVDDTKTAEAGARMGAGLSCLDDVLPALIASRAYRAVGAGHFAAGEMDAADRWFLTSLEITPTWEYGLQDIPDGHPLRPHFDELKLEPATDPVELEGKVFKEGKYYLNGRNIKKPKARLNRFNVFQAQTSTLETTVIVGNQFPGDVLDAAPSEAGPVAAGGKTKKPKKDKTAKVKAEKGPKPPKGEKTAKADKPPKPAKTKSTKTRTKTITLPDGTTKEIGVRERPPEKIPLLIAGGAILAGSGIVYALAAGHVSDMKGIVSVREGEHMAALNGGVPFPDDGAFRYCEAEQAPGTNDCFARPDLEVASLARKANNLVLTSLSMLAVGVGVTTWGVLVDGDSVMPTVNVRF